MICEESPRPLPEGTSTSIVSLISKMLRKDPFHRPKIDELVICPYLVPFIIRIYLNLGRISNVINKGNGNYDPEIFLRFLKSQVFEYVHFSVGNCLLHLRSNNYHVNLYTYNIYIYICDTWYHSLCNNCQ